MQRTHLWISGQPKKFNLNEVVTKDDLYSLKESIAAQGEEIAQLRQELSQ